MTLVSSLDAISDSLSGERADLNGVEALENVYSKFPGVRVLRQLAPFRLVGTEHYVDADLDLSGLGADILWLSPIQALSEATEAEPGKSFARRGYVPVGACLNGSGDPYFIDVSVDLDDPKLVRIVHDGDPNAEDTIETVLMSLSQLFRSGKLQQLGDDQ